MSKDRPLDEMESLDRPDQQGEAKTRSLSGWARRKHDVQAENEALQSQELDSETPGSTTETVDEELPIPEDLKDIKIEELDESFDFTRFMQEDVPEFLRHKALRQLWRTNPVLANIDGMNDYDEDFTDAAVGVEAMKGMFEKTMARLKQEEAEQAEATAQKEDKEAGEQLTTAPGEADRGEGLDPNPPSDHQERTRNSQNLQGNETVREGKEFVETISSSAEPDEPHAPEESKLSLLAKHGWLQV